MNIGLAAEHHWDLGEEGRLDLSMSLRGKGIRAPGEGLGTG